MPNQINEDELQKAIDDITSSAQNEVSTEGAPVSAPGVPAADPVAAGMGPAPVAPAAPAAPAPEVAPMPDLGMPPVPPMPAEMPAAPGAVPAPEATPVPEAASIIAPPEDVPVAGSEAPEAAEAAPNTPVDAGTEQIKADILRDLSPLMDKIQMEPEKKFHIYKDMMVTNGDKSVIPSAYETAKQIGDEQQRGEALLSLIDAIDG